MLCYNQLMINPTNSISPTTFTKEEFTIKSNHDGLNLGVSLRIPGSIQSDIPKSIQSSTPENTLNSSAKSPKGIVQLVHGMAEHRERYHAFMDYLAAQGYVVIIHDHRGHGASLHAEGDYGYFGKDAVNGIIDDVHQITEYIKQRFPGLPLTLLGHSMGSLVVRCYMKQYDQDVNRLVVCGSPSKNPGAGVAITVSKFLQLFQGEHHQSKFVNHLAFSGYNQRSARLARANGNLDARYDNSPNAWVVSDPAVVAAYDADERDGFVFTLNGFITLFSLMKRAYSPKDWQMRNPAAPVLFVSGADDPCIISRKDFEKAVNFMRARGYQDVVAKLYPKMRHEILNERGKEQVWADILGWIESGKIETE